MIDRPQAHGHELVPKPHHSCCNQQQQLGKTGFRTCCCSAPPPPPNLCHTWLCMHHSISPTLPRQAHAAAKALRALLTGCFTTAPPFTTRRSHRLPFFSAFFSSFLPKGPLEAAWCDALGLCLSKQANRIFTLQSRQKHRRIRVAVEHVVLSRSPSSLFSLQHSSSSSSHHPPPTTQHRECIAHHHQPPPA